MPKSKKKSKTNNTKIVFISAFVITFIVAVLVMGIALKHFSPTVDVNIGQNEIQTDDTDSDSDIDDRLKWIQYEDNQEPTSEKYLKAESDNPLPKDNKVKATKAKESLRPNSATSTSASLMPEEIPLPVSTKYITVAPVPTIKEVQQVTPAPSIKVTKVYVGFYNSSEEATAAKTKISQSIPGIQPFIKAVNGQYIVQAGSFADRRKAVELRDELSNRGFTARLLSD